MECSELIGAPKHAKLYLVLVLVLVLVVVQLCARLYIESRKTLERKFTASHLV